MRMKVAKIPVLRTVISMMLSPAAILKTTLAGIPWFFSLAVSALAFALFFLQTGLDLYRTGQKQLAFALGSAGAGAVYGATVIPLLAAAVWAILKITRTDKPIGWAVSSFCLSYSGALVYGLAGLFFSLLWGWKTSVAFGVTGVLWATGPLIVAVREMTGGNSALSVFFATVAGLAVLLTWSVFGRI